MDYLVMRLYAPLSAWGTLAVGEDRPTVSYPTRGAILGLLGAALGIKRSDTQRLQDLSDSINFASKTYSTGTVLRDYHTIQTPRSQKGVNFFTRKQELASDKIETILSSRDYREDGLWVVAIWLTSEDKRTGVINTFNLAQLQSALLCPKFTLYIGRKSCPLSLPLSPKIVSVNSLKTALDMDVVRFSNEDNLESTNNRGWRKTNQRTNELLEQVVSDKWLPTNIVYKRSFSNSVNNEDSDDLSSDHKSQRLRQITYHWEGSKDALFLEEEDESSSNTHDANNVYTYSYWDDPTNRQQWQFSQRVGHEWTTLEPIVSMVDDSDLFVTNDGLDQSSNTVPFAGGSL